MTVVAAPLAGTLVALEAVPDPVFAQGLVGKGFAIEPQPGQMVEVSAPIRGTVVKVHPHAFVVSDGAVSVLVHLGLDTVKLEGVGFDVEVAAGDQVEADQVLVRWDPGYAREAGYATVCPVVFLEAGTDTQFTVAAGEPVRRGETVVELSEGED